MDDSDEARGPGPGSLIRGGSARDESCGDRRAEEVERSFKWAPRAGRSRGPALDATGREKTKNCWAHRVFEQAWLNRSLRYESESEIKESSHAGKYTTCAHTQVTWLLFQEFLLLAIMSQPCLFPTSFGSLDFFFRPPNKDSSDHSQEQTRGSEKKKSMVPFFWKIKTF